VSNPIWGSWLDIYYCLTVKVLFLWGAISDERTGLSFVYAAGPRQRSLGTRDHILLSQIWDFLFRRLLQLAGSRWRYLTPPPHGSPLSVSSVSHPLKIILYRLEREHPVEPFNFLLLLLVYSLPQNLTVKASVSVVMAYYIRVSDAAVVSVFISAETETSSNCRRCLAMDDRVDSNNQSLSRTPQYSLEIKQWNRMPITVAARSKPWTAFGHSNAGIVCSNPTRGMDVCVRLFCVCCPVCR
jgi:hypothetical protein